MYTLKSVAMGSISSPTHLSAAVKRLDKVGDGSD